MAMTPLPSPPSTSDPANFNTKADAWVAALTLFQSEANGLSSTAVTLTGGLMTAPLGFSVGSVGSPSLYFAGDTNLGLYRVAADRMGITCNGILTGEFRADTAAFSLPLGRLAFPAAQNASSDVNTLDDYEEGTFTPGVIFGGASTGITYSLQLGTYTKIGNRVLFHAVLIMTSNGTATGFANMTGLPFTHNASFNDTVCNFRGTSITNTIANTVGQINFGATTIEMVKFAAGVTTQMTEADLPDGSNLAFSGQYLI